MPTDEDLLHVHTTVTVILNRHLATVSGAGDDVRNLVDRRDAKRATAGTRGSETYDHHQSPKTAMGLIKENQKSR